MTTFEIIVAVAIIAIVVLKLLEFTGMATTYVRMKEGFECLAKKIEYCDSKLGYIKGTAQDISQQLDNIEDSILDDLRDMNSQSICWNELTDDQKSEILYRLTHPVVESPFKPPFNPTCETTNKED